MKRLLPAYGAGIMTLLLSGCTSAPSTAPVGPQNRSAAPSAAVTQPAVQSHDAVACTPAFNAKLASLITSQTTQDVDNVGVCGVSVRYSRAQRGGPHGDHQVISVRATMPSGQQQMVEVVTNDDLDGVVSAKPNDAVIAFGQGYMLTHGQYAAGVHDVHCSTHSGADNGYVNIAGRQYPASCPPVGQFHGNRRRSRETNELPSF